MEEKQVEIKKQEERGRLAFHVMQKLSFVRESCTPAELEAVQLICSEIRKIGSRRIYDGSCSDSPGIT